MKINNQTRKLFSDRLNKAIFQSGRSNSWIALRLRVDRSAVTNWLNKGVIPEMGTLIALADLLNVSVSYLIGETDEQNDNRKIASDYTGLSQEAIDVIHNMKDSNRAVLDDFLTADIDIDESDVDLEYLLDVSENVKNNSDLYNESEKLGLDDWNITRYEVNHKDSRQNSLMQASFLFRDFLKAVYPLKK